MCPSIVCPIWILSTMLVSNHGCQTLDFCCEQEKCQGIDSVPSVKTIATLSPWHLIQIISSEFFLIKLILKLRSHDLQGFYIFIQELFNVPACSYLRSPIWEHSTRKKGQISPPISLDWLFQFFLFHHPSIIPAWSWPHEPGSH